MDYLNELEQFKSRLQQLEEDIKQLEQILSAKGHPEWFTDYILDQYNRIIEQKLEIQAKIRKLEKN